MRVIVTGGTGNVGVATVRRLVSQGHAVTVVGRRANHGIPGAAYSRCDVADYESLAHAVRGNDAIVHLAAYGNPNRKPGRAVFRVNALGSFHVFEAAAAAGVRRVVGASSINALGYFFGDRGVPISYLPIDEEHPALATDAYSFSKQVMESVADYYWERDGIVSVMLRLPHVIRHEQIVQDIDHYATYSPNLIVRLFEMNPDERQAELSRLQIAFDRFRRANRADQQTGPDPIPTELTGDEAGFLHHKANLFTYIDEHDCAQAIEKGLTAEFEGSHALFVNAAHNALGLPLSDVAKLFEPDHPDVRPAHGESPSIVSIDRAREVIGFEPEWTITGRFQRDG